MTRYEPTRAGIINMWDYRDEEFSFAHGWLILRGPNGSGKTKALEVLFPFVLDGRIDPKRLNPFAAQDRTMKSNLLYRGMDNAVGYVWLEFRHRDTRQAVTVGIGLHAQRHRDTPVRWHFVADGRVGEDFSLLTDDDRPMTRKQLAEEIGDANIHASATEYRAAVDARLFGLGAERYEQLVTLILTLRRPQLAKNLDPVRLSDTLTNGLRPIDDDLVNEAARSFDDMEAVTRTLEGLVAADEATAAFLASYTTYLRTHARAAADALTRRREAAQAQRAATAAGEEAERAAQDGQRVAEDRREQAETAVAGLRGRIEQLRASGAYQAVEQMGDLERLVRTCLQTANETGAELDRRQAATARARSEAKRAGAELADLSVAATRAAAELLDHAARAGIEWRAADGAVASAVEAAGQALAAWSSRHSGLLPTHDWADLTEALGDALAQFGEPDAALPESTYNAGTAPAEHQEKAARGAEMEAIRLASAATERVASGRAALRVALDEELATARGLAPFAARELLDVLACPPGLRWPADEDEWTGGETPPAALAIHDAILTATRGMSATETSQKASTTRLTRALEELQAQLAAAGQDYHPEWDSPDGVIVVRIADEQGPLPAAAFANRISAARRDQHLLLSDNEQRILADALLTRLAQQIHDRTADARDLIRAMNREMRERRMSSGKTVGVSWQMSDALYAEQRAVVSLLDTESSRLAPESLARLRAHFADRIKTERARHRDQPYRELLASVLGYRRWRQFSFHLVSPEGGEETLTRARHSRLSGGEQSVSLHLPLFAAAHATLNTARPDAPRLLALDEAFAGVDDTGRAELMSLAAQFDLDLFMTGYDLWATSAAVRAAAHYDLAHSPVQHTVSALLLVWDGSELIADETGTLTAVLGSPGTRRAATSPRLVLAPQG